MTNRLAHSQSLYLQKHAENPIDWWPWCDEAIAKARTENKPIFLSIGYSSCHWCTVMEGEAFSDGAIAEYMNAQYIPIKVDREERPDIDSIYMQALQLMTGQGGWPLNVFLEPQELVPFYGGTYFPQEPRYGRPGFLQVLQALRHFYDTERDKLQSVTGEIMERLQQSGSAQDDIELSAELLRGGLEYSAGILSAKAGGPSFPMIPYANAAAHGMRFATEGSQFDAVEASRQRGLNLALGGIFDHVAGGFHRYTVDPSWTVPHFEKMLYDNGQIVEFLANLWGTGMEEPAFQRAIAQTVHWLTREMIAKDGYFYAAQDADSFVTPEDAEPEEGAFYVWTYAELQNLLNPDELAELEAHFTISQVGNFEGKNVLQRRNAGELSDRTEAIIRKLFKARYGLPDLDTFPPAHNNEVAKNYKWTGRIPAVTDTKMIVAWNSLMISGLARAAMALQERSYLKLAIAAANFILNHQQVDGRLHRLNYNGQASVIAQSEDYALLIKALLDLHQACLIDNIGASTDHDADGIIGQTTDSPYLVTAPIHPRITANFASSAYWLSHAIKLQTEFDKHLWSADLGGYFNTDARDDLMVRERSVDDNALPSANGVAIANLVRLFLLTEDLDYFDQAEQALQAFSSVMAQSPSTCPSLFTALDWFRNATLVRSTPEHLAPLIGQHLPTAMLRLDFSLPEGAIALVCQGLSCKAPATTPEHMFQQIEQSWHRA
ncbi:thioredoxin domain-containing protein [Leptolyngbya sp. AN02str]|uniref:thioredoxin domain-containing protein n=1 Tax=Leptolyngbya sp. AN02str TaxID=3423363 RepID=UPI003D3196FB